jgi:hypothetical protein
MTKTNKAFVKRYDTLYLAQCRLFIFESGGLEKGDVFGRQR